MTARMRAGATTDDYRAALSGEGEFGSLGYDWSDKPHRLVYDLCGEVDQARTQAIDDCIKVVASELNALPPPERRTDFGRAAANQLEFIVSRLGALKDKSK